MGVRRKFSRGKGKKHSLRPFCRHLITILLQFDFSRKDASARFAPSLRTPMADETCCKGDDYYGNVCTILKSRQTFLCLKLASSRGSYTAVHNRLGDVHVAYFDWLFRTYFTRFFVRIACGPFRRPKLFSIVLTTSVYVATVYHVLLQYALIWRWIKRGTGFSKRSCFTDMFTSALNIRVFESRLW